MSGFLQLHYLTVYPISNPNRDDLGRPKTAVFGGANRLRISSQSLKRAARCSDTMQCALAGQGGKRTRLIGEDVRDSLKALSVSDDRITAIATRVAEVFGEAATDAEGRIITRQLAFVSPDERSAAIEWAGSAAEAGWDPPSKESAKKKELKELRGLILRKDADRAADIAMFGRMMAGSPDFNREAAVQVSHAFTTHRAIVDDDYYTAVDDLKKPSEDAGAGFVGEAGFGSGVFYTYACVDIGLLVRNLDDDRELAARSAGALAEALATATPSGKRNSFAHQTRAGFIRTEVGTAQPRSLAGAFFKPVECHDLMAASVEALESLAAQLDAAYGACCDKAVSMNVATRHGTLAAIRAFAESAIKSD
ncbi:MAG: type I-E CRISPR-associated protein Cas7/Cse4/CasC [Acidobacteriota bacterium]|nr:type I-E CRISPR-associated protein Cas7/Cse4/CasC [Acidobacteriota bacterium]